MEPRIDIDDRQVLIQLERLRDAVRDQGALEAMRAIGRYMKTSTQLRFRRQLDPDGVRWIPSRAAVDRGGQTLRHTNRLYRSLTWRASPSHAEAGTNVVYARVHQFGIARQVSVRQHTRASRPGADGSARRHTVRAHTRPMRMHRRAFLGFSLSDRSQIFEILRRHIARAAGR